MARPIRTLLVLIAAGAIVAAGGCRLKDQTPPPLSGPSELGLSVTLTAVPDSVTRDGASQATVTIVARNDSGQPLANVSIRLDVECLNRQDPPARVVADYGTLSAKTAATGGDGRATVVYTAPPSGGPLDAFCQTGQVWVVATPIGTDAANAIAREIRIRLVETGIIVPPSNLQPAFTFTPTAPREYQTVAFDASKSTGEIAAYNWSFGDGATATGKVASHQFTRPGTFQVTLTVSDALGRAASTSAFVEVGVGVAPTAAFTFSPTQPRVGEAVFFNASASTAAAGRSLVGYSWNFGDGSTGSGPFPSRVYAAAGTYVVTLTVTDDIGRQGIATQNVTVGSQAMPTASFSFSPTSPVVGQEIGFDASASTPSPGATITSYQWDFGDGNTETGRTTRHTYRIAGTFFVRLTVTDSAGLTATASQTLSLTAGLVADFTFSPTSPTAGATVALNASISTAAPGRSITNYIWDYGNGTPPVDLGASPTTTVVYAAPGTYTVTLRIRDDLGNTAVRTKTITVS